MGMNHQNKPQTRRKSAEVDFFFLHNYALMQNFSINVYNKYYH